MIVSLAKSIREASEPKDSVYNSSLKQEKDFTGNMVMFAKDSKQYGKRFKKQPCCASKMIAWGKGENTVSICSVCGYIESEKSKVIPVIENNEIIEETEPDISVIKEIEKDILSI